MNIAYEAKRITHNGTGLGAYGRTLINNLVTYFPNESYWLYTSKITSNSLISRLCKSNAIKFKYRNRSYIKGRPKLFWRTHGVLSDLKKDKPDIFHGISGELPIGIEKSGIKSVVTVHDLIFLRYPQYYKWIDRKIYTYKFKRACQKSDRVVAVSETTKNDIIKFFYIPSEKIEVIYQDCDKSFKVPQSIESKLAVRGKYDLPERFILYLGSIEQRKNLLLLVKALEYLKIDIPVLAIGRKTPYTKLVQQYVDKHNLGGRVIMKSGIPTSDLPAIYQQASVFVYPSYFEGFGIPILEALHSKVPVVAASGSCLHESGGPDSLYVDPDNPKELAKALTRVLTDKTLAQNMIEKGKKYAEKFDSEKLTQQLYNLYRDLLFK